MSPRIQKPAGTNRIVSNIAKNYSLEGLDRYDHLVFELLHEIALKLEDLSNIVFDDEAVSPSTLQGLKQVSSMLQDAVYLAALSPSSPQIRVLPPKQLKDLLTDD